MQGPLGCLLGFWPSGPKSCRGAIIIIIILKQTLTSVITLTVGIANSELLPWLQGVAQSQGASEMDDDLKITK